MKPWIHSLPDDEGQALVNNGRAVPVHTHEIAAKLAECNQEYVDIVKPDIEPPSLLPRLSIQEIDESLRHLSLPSVRAAIIAALQGKATIKMND